ncbi:flagellar basal body P-ring protein FlgI [Geomesophilobacter sediminis]|uniref:Flagellar P-ring protein n=1 Tax=Geomesophilobacter sediminis TaxID=2798584 RepID=A0A8J7LYH7_9BACT|nr:flagellar basal body P-ring protein FlgI [Geomesophilobacter sediminis]MBJ6724822.1 flagellar basal body P-ring protein FlgI [Geomesophilobacter sediminis]
MKAKTLLAIVALLLALPLAAQAARIKDIASFDGVRDNQIIGYGLVVGLNGTGDSQQTFFPVQSLANALERMGVTINKGSITVKNVAAVMVTANLPPFAKQGNKLDVLVSSLGDATSLAGGTLLMAPLKGGDSQIYAVAQGAVLTNSFSYSGQAASAQKNHPTAGTIPGGGLVERELPNVLADKQNLRLNLHQADFTTAERIAQAVNTAFGAQTAALTDPGSVQLAVPAAYRGRVVQFVADLERLDVNPDVPARVVMNERTGTIVMGENVRISTVAVSHGNLTVVVKETPQVSQPGPLSSGTTTTVPRTSIKVKEDRVNLSLLREGANLGDVVRGLNLLGVTPRDLIGIMQAIKAAGALNAELTVL